MTDIESVSRFVDMYDYNDLVQYGKNIGVYQVGMNRQELVDSISQTLVANGYRVGIMTGQNGSQGGSRGRQGSRQGSRGGSRSGRRSGQRSGQRSGRRCPSGKVLRRSHTRSAHTRQLGNETVQVSEAEVPATCVTPNVFGSLGRRSGQRSGRRSGQRSGGRGGQRSGQRSGGRGGQRSGGRGGQRSGRRSGRRSGQGGQTGQNNQ